MHEPQPVWDTDIAPLFAQPYWIDQDSRARIGYYWTRCMSAYLIDFKDRTQVKEWSETIYNHLASRNMPLTTDTSQYWPAEALETFRIWINQGWRENNQSPFDRQERIPAPSEAKSGLRVRKDISTLTDAELTEFRVKLDDVMKIMDPSPDSPWQKWAYLHTNWCLHYQEAFGFWHRAFLMNLEDQIDMALPYWDFMAAEAADPISALAGLPQAFLDETYIHPERGEQPNPLRYAAAKDGRSKLCVLAETDPALHCEGDACRHVNRYPVFTDPNATVPQPRPMYFAMPAIFQRQVFDALKFDNFSTPQGVWGQQGTPWANIPTFDPPQPDDLYPYREINFDGLFEQPHDNYHGWIGYDMADNAYTAFDPIFLAYHANIDRMLEVWIRAHPAAQYTSQTQIQPFVGPLATDINEASPDWWRYTTVGQMAQDSRRLGYDFGPPAHLQFKGASPKADNSTAASKVREPAVEAGPWVAFDGVRCTHNSYTIDVFVNKPDAQPGDVGPECPNYVGRFSRIGMGIEDDKGRCIRHGVSRLMSAAHVVKALGLDPDETIELTALVASLKDQSLLTMDEVAELPGFTPVFLWGDPRQPILDVQASPCCH